MKHVGPVLVAWGLLLAAAAAAAGPPPAIDTTRLDFQPLPRSLLVSRAEPVHVLAQVQRGPLRTLVLARRTAGAAPVPAAVLVQRQAGAQLQLHVTVQWLPAAGNPALDVLTLEHLYALALRQEPTARYCLVRGSSRQPQACDPSAAGVSHDRLLGQIAAARGAALARVGLGTTSVAWHGVTMAPAASSGPEVDDVAVRILGPTQQPLEGVTVYFNRAPHSGCGGRSGPDGQARCRLVDQHGDDGDHDDAAQTPVVVTFPGDVRPGRVLLPTTYVVPGTPP